MDSRPDRPTQTSNSVDPQLLLIVEEEVGKPKYRPTQLRRGSLEVLGYHRQCTTAVGPLVWGITANVAGRVR